MKQFWELPAVNLGAQETLDRLRVRELVEFDRYCYDYGHKDIQRTLWFDDGRVFTTWIKGSVDEYLKGQPTKRREGDVLSSHAHRINNTVVWLHGDRAIAEILCSLNFRTKIAWEWMDLQCWCRMHYRVERRQGRWGIVYFEGIYEKDRMDPVFLDSRFEVPRDELMKHRPNNWNMAFRRDVLGGASDSDEWAGPDRPETIQRLYDESSRWMGLDDGGRK